MSRARDALQAAGRWLARAWPWLAAAVTALVTLGLVRRFGEARARSAAARAQQEREREAVEIARLEAAQRRASAQRDALMDMADEIEAKARATERLDEALQAELAALRERVPKMTAAELRAEAQAQAKRYRDRVTGGIVLAALMMASTAVRAEDICLPREDVEMLVIATNEANTRIDALTARAEHWEHDAEVLRLAVSTGRSAEDAATARAEFALEALEESERDAAAAETRARHRLIAMSASVSVLTAVVLLGTLAVVRQVQ